MPLDLLILRILTYAGLTVASVLVSTLVAGVVIYSTWALLRRFRDGQRDVSITAFLREAREGSL